MKFTMNETSIRSYLEFGELNISGNEHRGFRPDQLLIASIASCSAMVFLKILEKQGLVIKDLHIDAAVERNKKEANRIAHLSLTFIVYGEQLNEKKLQKNIALARKNCAMVRSVEDSIEISEYLTIVDSSRKNMKK